MRLRLHIKFALWLLLAGLVPLAILGGYSLISVKKTVENSARHSFAALAHELANEVSRIIHDGIGSVGYLAENPLLAAVATDTLQLENELKKTQRFHPIIKDLTLLDTDGTIRASALYSFRGDWRSTSWYRQAINGEKVFTGVHAVLYPYEVVMTTAAPVRDPATGRITAVLVGQLDMDPLWKIFSGILPDSAAKLMLVDSSSTIVASSEKEEILSAVSPEIARIVDGREHGYAHIQQQTGEELMVFTSLPTGAAGFVANWHIIIRQPAEVAYAAITGIWRGLLLAAAVSLAVIAIVSTILSRHINSRIRPLITATRNLGKEEIGLSLERLGEDEIGELGQAFVSTSSALAASNREVRKYQETLEDLVDTRTRALQEANVELQKKIEEHMRMEEEREQLERLFRQSQKMEAVGTLAGGIAHDFNNILQMISGQVQLLLLKREEKEGDHQTLSEIDQTISRASELVRRLLTFSRKMETAPQRMNLNDMVESTVRLLRRTIPKMITIETSLEENLADVRADYNQMEQILMNLTSNGADAMPDGGVLRIATENRYVDKHQGRSVNIEEGEYVVLCVSDEGIGMDEGLQKRIFEPFFTSKEIGKGTGLGLSTVYGIVQDHGGSITCASQPGQGTTFTIFFPALAKRAKELPPAPQIEETPQLSGLETILVVDDEAIVREIAEDMLSRFGYRVLLAENGEEALELFVEKKEEIDLVLTDLGMPGMGGQKLIEKLRAVDSQIKIIIASGYLSTSSSTRAASLGAQAFLQKPYQLKIMLQTIRQTLDRQQVASGVDAAAL